MKMIYVIWKKIRKLSLTLYIICMYNYKILILVSKRSQYSLLAIPYCKKMINGFDFNLFH
ncbi:hypothetical protein ASZ90_006207 [hydrocarbon metagenome]|uniref:Uncharacterized protein n=1 Tax=hydrocarbon metagenome TaxID=938273 RepID=A0A0W8FSZ8_9ZZZZ